MSQFIQVTTTVNDKNTASKIASRLVSKKKAACVQISNEITSLYWWQGKVEEETEYYCHIKTSQALFAEVSTIIKEIHPYEVPEIIAVPLVNISPEYESWLSQSLS
ncbi:MAG: divalent-cation tolerance protein CutA [Spirochaetes bacterium]|nr:divalent-cation tolerance protein CutA [Spirochaetota bacterium]